MDVPKSYDVAAEEKKWKEHWRTTKLYSFVKKDIPGYVIDTPPPTLSGNMHIGHAFSYAQQDFIARYRRMKGENVCYPFGTDDNGLPTERLVEKTKNVRSTMMDRQEFIALCNTTVGELKEDFIADWISIGMSCDFDASYSTIDPHAIKTSQASFIDLFEKGRVYQEESPISWCTSCQTAIAQAEFESVDMASHFNDIIFKVGAKEFLVATTRPELLPSCVAVFAHPDDERFKPLFGKHAVVPLMNHEVPIMPDAKVDPEKGTGLVMCCTFGDKTDVEWWREYRLPLRVSIGKNGRMTEIAGPYAGLKVKEARKKIIDDLKAAGLLTSQKQIIHPVNTHERCGTDIEILKTKQWFVRVLDKKQELINAADQISWYPAHMKARYVHWVENLNWDWCISRQRHFGVPFPVWYEKDTGKVIHASLDQLPCDPLKDKPAGYAGNPENLVAEIDVMDTWATSSVTPLMICNWKSKGGYQTTMSDFPTAMRPQAHDIIRTWAFYTIVKSLFHTGTVPWRSIIISGHVLDPKGNKMSKSKGNTIVPQDVLTKYGADAMRFWAASSRLGDDIPFQDKELLTGKKTVTKLWNAASFVKMHLHDYDGGRPGTLHAFDEWLLAKMNTAIAKATAAFEENEYAKARQAADHFFWKVLCDNYLEVIKDRMYNPASYGEHARQSAQYALSKAIRTVLGLYAPIMPFITESLYQYHFKESHSSIHICPWPTPVDGVAMTLESSGDAAVELLSAIRTAKSTRGDALNAELMSLRVTTPAKETLLPFVADIKGAAKARVMDVVEGQTISVVYEKAQQ